MTYRSLLLFDGQRIEHVSFAHRTRKALGGFDLIGGQAGHRVEQMLFFAALEIVRGHRGHDTVVEFEDELLMWLLAANFDDGRDPAGKRDVGKIRRSHVRFHAHSRADRQFAEGRTAHGASCVAATQTGNLPTGPCGQPPIRKVGEI